MAVKRTRFNVGAVKIPAADRDVARSVLQGEYRRGYRDVLGSDTPDDDDDFPIGSTVAYSLMLTEEEAARFAAASNARYVEEDKVSYPTRWIGRPVASPQVPSDATFAYSRMRYEDLRKWHGRDVRMCVLDQGTTAAVRSKMGWTLVARKVHSGIDLGSNELYNPDHGHGCLVGPNLVPAGGQILDGIVSDANGAGPDSALAAGVIWAVDNGAKVVNLSWGSIRDSQPNSGAVWDAFVYARDRDVIVTVSAGNDDTPKLSFPAMFSRNFWNVHSCIAFDEHTDSRGLFSNYHADASGCASGVDVISYTPTGALRYWNGTSASAPHMGQLMGRALTSGQFTVRQVSDSFKANTRKTGASATLEGGGVYDFHRAMAGLAASSLTPSVASGQVVSPVQAVGAAAPTSGYQYAPASGIQVGDLQVVCVFAGSGAVLRVPYGWVLLTESKYTAAYEQDHGQAVLPSTIWVLAKPYESADPATTLIGFTNGAYYSAFAAATVRTPGGIDPEKLVPITKFGTGITATTAEVLPNYTNDLVLTFIGQRHNTAVNTRTLSLPSGMTQQGFWRPTTDTPGCTILAATKQLASGAFVPAASSTNNNVGGTWGTVTMTIPGAATPLATVSQPEPSGSPSSFLPLYFPIGYDNGLGSAGGGGGGEPEVPQQTLGIGGIATPPDAIKTTGNSTSTLNITQANKVFDGQGFTVPKINVSAPGVTVQNFNVSGGTNAGIYVLADNCTIQNNRVTQISSDGDANGMTFFGNGTKILFNEIGTDTVNLLKGSRNGAHLDGMQTWNTPSKQSSSDVLIKGNRIVGPNNTETYISQAIMAQGKKATDGGGGGTGVSENWVIEDNYIRIYGGNQTIKLDDINNVTIRRNTFAGSTNKIVAKGSFSTGINFVTSGADANIITGQYNSQVGD